MLLKPRCHYSTLLCIVLFALLAVCLDACSSPKDQEPAVRLGYLQNDLHHLPVFVALEKGFFKQAGIEVEVAGIFRAGPEEMSAFAAREIDIGCVGQAPATAAVLNGVADVKYVSQINLEGSSIVLRKETAYNKLSDLAGKTVAIPGHATMQDFLFRKAMQKANVPMDKIKLIVLKPPEMLQALSLGNIDAFIAWEPYPSQAVQKGIGRVMVSSEQIWQNHPCCVLAAETGFCRKNPQKINKIRAVLKRASGFITKNRKEAVEIGIKYTGMDRNTVTAAISQIKYHVAIDRKKALEFVDFLRDLRYIKFRKIEKPLSDLFYE